MLAFPGNLNGSSYRIERSLRFRSSASAYLSRTFTTPTNQAKWTWSGWVKRGTLGSMQRLLSSGTTASDTATTAVYFLAADTLAFSGGATNFRISSQVFRDVSAWYHIVISIDTTQAVESNKILIYVNGNQITFSTTNAITTCAFNSAQTANIGQLGGGHYLDGYLAEVNFIDGQALTPAAFGAISSATGVWAPKRYTGTYGTNGFYLDFADNSAASATAIGKDASGNSNNWTPTNISMVAGATFDSMTDTPTPYGNATYYSGWNPSYGLQFRSSADAYLSRSFVSTPTTYTFSFWVKRATVGVDQLLFASRTSGSGNGYIGFVSTNKLRIAWGTSSIIDTTEVYTDTSAWYHFVVSVTSSGNLAIYSNGVQVLSSAAAAGAYVFNSALTNTIGRNGDAGGFNFNGVLADVNFIDGQALTPAAFAETVDGRWVPKTYTGTYGTNGFYLNFANRSAMTPAAIGDDASSNNNQWTPVNMAIADAVDYGVKGVRGNYATLNPLDGYTGSTTLARNGNLQIYSTSVASYNSRRITAGMITGKWYMEFSIASQGGAGRTGAGLYAFDDTLSTWAGNTAKSWGYNGNGNAYFNSTNIAISLGSYGVGDVIMMAFDADAGKLWFGKNGTWAGDPATGSGNTYGSITAGPYSWGCWAYNTSDSTDVNFGQRPFAYTPPAGFKALCTHNLPAPTIKRPAQYMAATTYTGTGVGRTITNTVNNKSFQPDLVWIKNRTAGTSHALFDSTRGSSKYLSSDTTTAETTNANTLTAFNENGFSLGTDTTLVNSSTVNANSYVAWQWKEGAAAGLDIVSYSGTGANTTIAHNLGVAPAMIIVKRSQTGSTSNWQVRHTSIAAANSIQLNGTSGATAAATVWNSTAPTSSVFSIGTSTDVNASGVGYVAYCFAEIAGYSKFGSYTGNGSADGPFVFCGLRPRWIMIKRTDATSGWWLFDTSRDTDNVVPIWLAAESAQADSNLYSDIDILSNGFKIRSNQALYLNVSNGPYIYAAFAEVPSKYALAR